MYPESDTTSSPPCAPAWVAQSSAPPNRASLAPPGQRRSSCAPGRPARFSLALRRGGRRALTYRPRPPPPPQPLHLAAGCPPRPPGPAHRSPRSQRGSPSNTTPCLPSGALCAVRLLRAPRGRPSRPPHGACALGKPGRTWGEVSVREGQAGAGPPQRAAAFGPAEQGARGPAVGIEGCSRGRQVLPGVFPRGRQRRSSATEPAHQGRSLDCQALLFPGRVGTGLRCVTFAGGHLSHHVTGVGALGPGSAAVPTSATRWRQNRTGLRRWAPPHPRNLPCPGRLADEVSPNLREQGVPRARLLPLLPSWPRRGGEGPRPPPQARSPEITPRG